MTTETENKTQATEKRIAMAQSLRFGTEIEFCGVSSTAAATAIAGAIGGEARGWSGAHLGRASVLMQDGRVWNIVSDSSIRDTTGTGYTAEIVSPILTWSDLDTLQVIVRAIRAAGGKVNESCGQHVHVDGAAFRADPRKIRNLIGMASRTEDIAINISRQMRARTQWCASLVNPRWELRGMVERMKASPCATMREVSLAWYGSEGSRHHYDGTRYHWINLHALFDKGTVEFRLFNATLHAGEAKANVLFALGFAAAALCATKASFAGVRRADSRTLPGGRRPVTKHTARMFLLHQITFVGDYFKNYREYFQKAITAEDVRPMVAAPAATAEQAAA